MSLFFGGEKKEAVLFSPLEGKITFEGKPAAGAKIKLWFTWKDKEGESFYYTADENGFFKIPKHTTTYKETPLAQLVISQEITVEHEGKPYEMWVMSKMDSAIFTELGGEPINLRCELTNDLTTIRGNHSLGGTACIWDSLNN